MKTGNSPKDGVFHERIKHFARTDGFDPLVKYLNGNDLGPKDLTKAFVGMLLVSIAISIVLVVLAKQESTSLPVIIRWEFWLAHSICAILPLSVFNRLFRRYGVSQSVAAFLALVITLPLFTPLSIWLDHLFNVTELDNPETGSWWQVYISELIEIIPAVAVVWAVTASFIFFRGAEVLTGREHEPESNSEADTTNAEPRAPKPRKLPDFFADLPKELGAEIIALTAEQHYLTVYTLEGDALIHGALKEAIEALADISGLHIHRSHWVCRDHVKELVRREGNLYCVMSTGLELPISRRRRTEVQKALVPGASSS